MNSNVKSIIAATALLMTVALFNGGDAPPSAKWVEGAGSRASRSERNAGWSTDAAPEPPGYTWD